MKERKIPYRMCSVTRERFPKQELIRVVKTPDEKIVVDLTGKLNGHGAYIKKDVEVIKKASKSKVLEKMLETKIEDEIYEELLRIVENN